MLKPLLSYSQRVDYEERRKIMYNYSGLLQKLTEKNLKKSHLVSL